MPSCSPATFPLQPHRRGTVLKKPLKDGNIFLPNSAATRESDDCTVHLHFPL